MHKVDCQFKTNDPNDHSSSFQIQASALVSFCNNYLTAGEHSVLLNNTVIPSILYSKGSGISVLSFLSVLDLLSWTKGFHFLIFFNYFLIYYFSTCTFRASCYSIRLSWAHTSVMNWAVCLGQKVSS